MLSYASNSQRPSSSICFLIFQGYAYDKERIVFLQEALVNDPGVAWAANMGGLYGASSTDAEGHAVSNLPWRGGFMNGKAQGDFLKILCFSEDLKFLPFYYYYSNG